MGLPGQTEFNGAQAIRTAQEAVREDLVIIDTETTGLDADAQMVELAICDIAGNVLLDTLVRPTVLIPRDATRVHGITNNDVARAPTAGELAAEIDRVIGKRILASYNLEYDLRILNTSLRANGYPQRLYGAGGKWGDGLCIMKLFAAWYGDWSNSFQSFTWQPLHRAAAALGVDANVSAHRALSDAQTARAVLIAMASTSHEGYGRPVPGQIRSIRLADLAAAPPPSRPSLRVGDLVRHRAFGEGIVTVYNPSASDDEVTVEFAGGVGVKRLLLSFAPLEKLDD